MLQVHLNRSPERRNLPIGLRGVCGRSRAKWFGKDNTRARLVQGSKAIERYGFIG